MNEDDHAEDPVKGQALPEEEAEQEEEELEEDGDGFYEEGLPDEIRAEIAAMPGQENWEDVLRRLRRNRRIAAIAIPVLLLAVAEFGYRYYDLQTSPEVRLNGVALVGQPISGTAPEAVLESRDAFRFLLIRVATENADEADVGEALAGIPGTLRVDDETGGRSWEIPILLSAADADIRRRSSVVSSLGSSIDLGVRYRIDYAIAPVGAGEKDFRDLYETVFPAGTRLVLRFSFSTPPGAGSRVFLAYSRMPRYLHQKLLESLR